MSRGALFRTGAIEKNRLEAFSDGVMAIVITLLILEVKVPEGLPDEAALWRALGHIAPVAGAWAVSFLFVLVFWVNHHYFVASLRHADRGLLWLNGLFLLSISATPFPTGLVGAYPGTTPPLLLLSGTMCATSLAFLLMRFYAGGRAGLLSDTLDKEARRKSLLRSAVAPVLYALAGLLAFLYPPGALLLQLLVPLLFFLRSPAGHGAEPPLTN